MLRLSFRSRAARLPHAARLASTEASTKAADPHVTVNIEDGNTEADEVGDDMSSRKFRAWAAVFFLWRYA